MSVKRTPRDTWQVRWRDNAGRQRARTFRRKQDAVDFERDTLVELRRGIWVDPQRGRVTVAEWAVVWLAGAHNIRPRTRRAYRQALDHILPELGHLQLGHVTDEHVDAYLKAKAAAGVAPSSVHRHYRTLRRMFRVAVERGRIPRSPVDPIEQPRIPARELRVADAVALEHLARAIDPRYRSLVLVAGWGGLRWGELAGLRVGRVDVVGSRLHVVEQVDLAGSAWSEPKTAAGRRWVGIPRTVTDDLATLIEGRGPADVVWPAPRGGALSHSNFVSRHFHPACVRAGLGRMVPTDDAVPMSPLRYEGFTIHDLRHTSVALTIAGGAHPKAIQARMGHSGIQVTMDRYGHLFPDADQTIAQRLDDARSVALQVRALDPTEAVAGPGEPGDHDAAQVGDASGAADLDAPRHRPSR